MSDTLAELRAKIAAFLPSRMEYYRDAYGYFSLRIVRTDPTVDAILTLLTPLLDATKEAAAYEAERYGREAVNFGDVPADPVEAMQRAARDIAAAIRAIPLPKREG